MQINPMLPRLEPVNLQRTSLSYVCSAWAMPKSQIQIPIISFSGSLGAVASISEDIRFMRWRCEELVSVIEAAHGMILDLRQLEIGSAVELDLVPASIRYRQEPVRVVVNPEAFNFTIGSFLPGEVSRDYQNAFSELALEFKEYRFDKGRHLTEPSKLPPPQLVSVSLDISAIQCEFYTWRLKHDELLSGYIVLRGQYQYGSAGSDDALFIKWRLNQFCNAIEPSRLIVDLRQLQYEWGDDLSLYPLCFLDPESPIRFLLTTQQVPSYESTIYTSNICPDEVAAFQDLGYEIAGT